MQNYHEMLERTLNQGVDQLNTRTGKLCRALVGYQLQYNLAEGFPAITTKKLAVKTAIGELLGFFRGYDNAADFRKLGCGIWDQNANETKAWLANPSRRGPGDLGRIYGKQWTDWRDSRVVSSEQERAVLQLAGYAETLYDPMKGSWLMERGINQLEAALRTLLTNPSDRRIMVTGWRPDEFDQMALPPCHTNYLFTAFENPKVLHMTLSMRSWDLLLGAPFNIFTGSLFLSIMARLSGYTPGTVTIQATNAHIYEDHFDQVREQLTRDHYPRPQLALAERVKAVSLAEVEGAFLRIEPEDIHLVGYEHHAAIKAPMAA